MCVLKIYWRVRCQPKLQKFWKFAWFCKNHDFQMAVRQKIFTSKGWFTIIYKVYMVLYKETKLSVYHPQLLAMWIHWVLKMGQTSKSWKLWVENPFLKSYIFWTMLWNRRILHKSENMSRNNPRNLKIK